MKVLILMKMNENAVGAAPPSNDDMIAMHKYNESLKAAGILKEELMGGLLPSKFAKQLNVSAATRSFTVTDGQFTETKEVVAGFAMWEVKSLDEAIEWAKKNPLYMDCTVELRPLFSPETWDPK